MVGDGDVLQSTPNGIYCAAGDFYIDPWRAVERAVITHAHSDHARAGSKSYLCSAAGEGVLRARLGSEARIESVPYGRELRFGEVRVSLHPAGHLLGSAQVRVERGGHVWVVSGDYKLQPDPTSMSFEPVRCHTFITESTFGLPIYRWPEPARVFDDVNAWWQANRQSGRTTIIFAYALGKAQRVLAGIDAGIGPIVVHGAIDSLLMPYRRAGIKLPEAQLGDADTARKIKGRGLVLAPMSARGTPWLRQFAPFATAMASGWMQVRGPRRRQAVDRGFVLSDHADWPGLLEAIRAAGAHRIGVTHGYTEPFVRYLKEQGHDAWQLKTRFTDEDDDREQLDNE